MRLVCLDDFKSYADGSLATVTESHVGQCNVVKDEIRV